MRALLANGNPGPYIIWGTGREPTYLHFSVLLFITGALIYLFNINRPGFYAMVVWVGYMAIIYTAQTVEPFRKPHTLFHTPFSWPALRIYLGISYAVFQVFSYMPLLHGIRNNIRCHYRHLSNRYSEGILSGKRKQTKYVALKPSSEIDTLILERILVGLDEDGALETFFDAIPGFCNSRSSHSTLSSLVRTKLQQALDGFLNRTFSSNLVSESVRVDRFTICLDAVHAALEPSAVSEILDNIFVGHGHWNQALQSVAIGHTLRLWDHRQDHDLNVRRIIACIIARVRERDDRWTVLVKEEFGVPDHLLQDSVAHRDGVLLFILIHISRQVNHAGSWTSGILSSLSKFDIHKTLLELQHEFRTIWNEIGQEARNQGSSSTPAKILRDILHLYIALHEGDFILEQPSLYPQCNIASHHSDPTTHAPDAISGAVRLPTQPSGSPDASPYNSISGGGTASPQAQGINIIAGLPSPSDPSTISEASQAPTASFPVHSSSHSSDSSPECGVATAQPDTFSASAGKLSHPPESNK
jgi:hypothetical protein